MADVEDVEMEDIGLQESKVSNPYSNRIIRLRGSYHLLPIA